MNRKTSYKKLGRNRKYYYFNSRGRRISSKKYYSSKKRKTLVRTNYKGRYAEGFNITKRVRWSIEDLGIDTISSRFEIFYQTIIKRRYKLNKKYLTGYTMTGYWYDRNDERIDFVRHSRSLLLPEFQIFVNRNTDIQEALEDLASIIGEGRYQIDDVVILTISLRQRKF